jgi:hypothetical protein
VSQPRQEVFFDFGSDMPAQKEEAKPALDFFNDLDFGQPVVAQKQEEQEKPAFDFGFTAPP